MNIMWVGGSVEIPRQTDTYGILQPKLRSLCSAVSYMTRTVFCGVYSQVGIDRITV